MWQPKVVLIPTDQMVYCTYDIVIEDLSEMQRNSKAMPELPHHTQPAIVAHAMYQESYRNTSRYKSQHAHLSN